VNTSYLIHTLVKRFPALIPYLSGRARWIAFATGDEYKTVDYFMQQVERLVMSLYSGYIGREFLDLMANLISGQLTQAFNQAWWDEEGLGSLPGYLQEPLQAMILAQYPHVDGLYADVVNARTLQLNLAPILARAALWGRQWDVAYKMATELINKQRGGNLMWQQGATEHGCSTCEQLDGIIMSALEWEQSGVHPRGYPNPMLECGGGGPVNNCDCELIPTDRRRSPKAYDRVIGITRKA
jgi:hypothetical protein